MPYLFDLFAEFFELMNTPFLEYDDYVDDNYVNMCVQM